MKTYAGHLTTTLYCLSYNKQECHSFIYSVWIFFFQGHKYLCSLSVTSDSWCQNILEANQKASRWIWNQSQNFGRFGWIFHSGKVRLGSHPHLILGITLEDTIHISDRLYISLPWKMNVAFLSLLIFHIEHPFSVPTAFLLDRVNIINYNHI